MPIILSNRLKAMQDAASNFGDSIEGIRAAQKKAAQQALEEQRAAAQETRAQEAHGVTMGRQKTAAGLEDMQFGQAKQQAAAADEANSLNTQLSEMGPATPYPGGDLPNFSLPPGVSGPVQDSGPTPLVANTDEALKDRLRASIHNASLRAKGETEGFVTAADVKAGRTKTAADALTKSKKDAADLASTEAGTKDKLANVKKTEADIKKIEADIANQAKGGIDPEKAASIESSLRTQYFGLNHPYQQARDAYSRMKSIKDSPIGDVGLVYSIMKIYDPGASVQEGDKANISNAASVPERIRNLYNGAMSGASLDQKTRDDIRAQGASAYAAQKAGYESSRKSFQALASKYPGLDPERAAPDLSNGVTVDSPSAGGAKQFKSAREAMASGLPPGTRVMINGEEAEL